NNIFLHRTFFISLGIIALIFVFGHFYPLYHSLAIILSVLLLVLSITDVYLLYRVHGISARREVSSILSNGDENDCIIQIDNTYSHSIYTTIYEEIPHQLALRELKFQTKLNSYKTKSIDYTLRPTKRGEYDFGDIVIMARSPLQLVTRRYVATASKKVSVYPSYIHLNRYSFKNFRQYTNEVGVKKTRRIGHSTEFEHIKGYVKGDDIRYINWKASAKRGDLMVNQYMDERAQQIYCAIDTGRAMQMPFEGLTLLDYSINSTLAMSHIIVKNKDRAGVLYFNKEVEKILPADKAIGQLPKILKFLYNLKTVFWESNFEKLYSTIKFKISHRSLILLYTNFEDMNSLHRQLPYLKGIARNNVLVVIFFKNSELNKVVHSKSETELDYYNKSVAEKLSFQKKLIVKELNKHGIQSVLTDPENLTIDTIDKYLEIKSRGLI
ncbi:MAG: DUF58 domain-containing protein, partial [Bacteroidia bacterium]